MVTQTAGRGLSTNDLTRIRDTLAAGRKPRVMFTEAAGQIAGQVGQVVRLTDPAVSEDWVVVRFGRDELPFSPTDLVVPPRGAAAKVAPSRETGGASAASLPSPREESPMPPAPSPAPPAATRSQAANGAAKGAVKDATAKDAARDSTPKDTTSKDGAVSEAVAAATPGDGRAERRAPARKAGKPKAPASLTVTLTYAEGEWMVGATQGAKSLAKPYLIKPAEALKMISLLDVPGVREAVEEIVSVARDEAERQAERLRAELAEVESRLAELRDAG
jgi:hypothetical protein